LPPSTARIKKTIESDADDFAGHGDRPGRPVGSPSAGRLRDPGTMTTDPGGAGRDETSTLGALILATPIKTTPIKTIW
jgi:hypothetical protein